MALLQTALVLLLLLLQNLGISPPRRESVSIYFPSPSSAGPGAIPAVQYYKVGCIMNIFLTCTAKKGHHHRGLNHCCSVIVPSPLQSPPFSAFAAGGEVEGEGGGDH